MPTVNGAFAFKDEGDGCLTSKYCTDLTSRPYTECCTSIKYLQGTSFTGDYTTTYIETIKGKVGTEEGTLNIAANNPFSGLYELTWKIGGSVKFRGVGMIYNDYLIGHYWDI